MYSVKVRIFSWYFFLSGSDENSTGRSFNELTLRAHSSNVQELQSGVCCKAMGQRGPRASNGRHKTRSARVLFILTSYRTEI